MWSILSYNISAFKNEDNANRNINKIDHKTLGEIYLFISGVVYISSWTECGLPEPWCGWEWCWGACFWYADEWVNSKAVVGGEGGADVGVPWDIHGRETLLLLLLFLDSSRERQRGAYRCQVSRQQHGAFWTAGCARNTHYLSGGEYLDASPPEPDPDLWTILFNFVRVAGFFFSSLSFFSSLFLSLELLQLL